MLWLTLTFDQQDSSSDGGALLLKAADQSLGLIQALGNFIREDRQLGKIKHSLQDLIQQRVFGIACGYEDCNDAARLSHDPVHRLMMGRDPLNGKALASQPTLSRFENAIEGRSLVRMGHALADRVIKRHRKRLGKRVRRVTIDMDPTDHATYGGQQLSFFHYHYDSWCYLPVACFLQFDDEPDQYLSGYVLRPGDVGAHYGAISLLRRTIEKSRSQFDSVNICVRLDSDFLTPELLDFLDELRVKYVVSIAKNAVLKAFSEPLMKKVRQRSKKTHRTERLFGECECMAKSWEVDRRVIFKAEVVCHPGRNPKENPRFVVTNLRSKPEFVYRKVYCQRANIENRIKELLNGLHIDRSSCTGFLANQLRCLLSATAYVLFQELRLAAAKTPLASAQVSTLRERLLKMAVWLKRSTRRVVFHLPDSAPYATEWCQIARTLCIAPT